MSYSRLLWILTCFAATCAAQCTVTFQSNALSAPGAGRAGTLTYTVNDASCYGSPVTSNATWIVFAQEGTGIGQTTTLNSSGVLRYYVLPNATNLNRINSFFSLNQVVTMTQAPGTLADPAVLSVSVPRYAVSGKTVEAIATVTNRGTATTFNFEVRFFWSTDPTITTADVNTGVSCNATLSAFADYRCPGQVMPPPAFGATYYLGALITDPTDTNTSNNTGIAANQVIVTAPCASLDTTPIAAGPDGASGILNVTAPANCSWSVFNSLPAGVQQMIQGFPETGTGNGQVFYTIYPNFRNLVRTGTLNVGGNPVTVNQSPDPNTTVARYIRLLYFTFLGRLPGADEIAGQSPFAQTSADRATLANFLLSTAEFNGKSRFVAGLYVGLLSRDAEFAGFLFQRNALTSGGVSAQQLVSNFLNSAEYQLRFGSPDNAEFVRLLYRNILLREASPDEVAFQANALNTGTTRVDMATNFLNTAEFRQGTGPRLISFLITAGLYTRDPFTGERQRLTDQLGSSFPTKDIISVIFATPEFTSQVE